MEFLRKCGECEAVVLDFLALDHDLGLFKGSYCGKYCKISPVKFLFFFFSLFGNWSEEEGEDGEK